MQDQLREQLLQSQQQAIELQAQCDAFETQVANSERLVATARIPRADKHSTDNDRMQQQLQNSREKLVCISHLFVSQHSVQRRRASQAKLVMLQ